MGVTIVVHSLLAWLEFVSLAFCIGVLVCRLFVIPPSVQTVASGNETSYATAWRLFTVALVIIFVSTVVDLLLRTATMSGRSVLAALPVISTVLSKTHYGRVWTIRVGALLLLCFLIGFGLRKRNSRMFLVSAIVLTLFIAATRSASGHASDTGDFSIAEIMDWLHLVSASVWGGGLMVLSLVILPEIIKHQDIPAPLLASVAGRFSRLAGAAVGVVAFTALYNAWLHLGSLRGLWLTAYGGMLVVKIVLFFLLVNLGAFNRYVSVPMLQQLGGVDPGRRGFTGSLAVRVMPVPKDYKDPRAAASRFLKIVRMETILIVIALLFAAILIQQVPARHALHAMSGHGHSQSMGTDR